MFTFPYVWTDAMRISFLQRVILIHSYLYYEKDSPLWSDRKYDEIAKQLEAEQKNYPKAWIKQATQYGYVFYDYDSSTGFDLWNRLKGIDKKQIRGIIQCMKR